jgi:hypothetical protein
MKGTEFSMARAGGIETMLPQTPGNATELQNWAIDRATGGWSTRIGYEKYVPYATTFAPFSSLGPVLSLHVNQALPAGGRQNILFEADGTLYLMYEADQSVTLIPLRTGRSEPAPTEPGSWFTDVQGGILVTNGIDRPILVRPWPLGDAADATTVASTLHREFGFAAPPAPPTPHRVEPLTSSSDSSRTTGGGATSIWCPSNAAACGVGSGQWGLGLSGGADKENLFSWSISFITDTGSEGPQSLPATASWQMNTAKGFRYAVALDIPRGPPGVVARKLYRSQNYSEDSATPGDNTLYFAGLLLNNEEELYIDAVRTPTLGTVAPTFEVGPTPAPTARFSAVFAGCLFLDGGPTDGQTIYFSNPGLIEQFSPLSYLTLPGQSGAITAMWGTYTSLLLFRESGIDVVTGDFSSSFRASTLSASVACRSPKAIVTVPELGVVFLGQDGIYLISGGLQGGSVVSIQELTGGLSAITARFTPDCLPAARAAYTPQNGGEVHFYIPVDGSDRPNLGLILHVPKLTAGLSAWSTRDGFPVGSIASLYDGTLIFGHHTGNPSLLTSNEAGIFVLSSRRALGGHIDGQTYVDDDPPLSIYKSAWMDFGDPQILKQVKYVTLWLMTTGGTAPSTGPIVKVRHYKDFGLTAISEREYTAQPPDAPLQPVFDLVTLNSGSKYLAERMVPLRVSIAGMSCQTFAFDLETTEDLVFVGFDVEFVSSGARVIAGQRA